MGKGKGAGEEKEIERFNVLLESSSPENVRKDSGGAFTSRTSEESLEEKKRQLAEKTLV